MKTNKYFFYSVIVLSLLALIAAFSTVKLNAEKKLQTTIEAQLLQIVNELKITLERHSYLPSLLANNNEIIDFLRTPKTAAEFSNKQRNINLSLDLTNNTSGTTTLFLLDPTGEVLSSSNWVEKDSFIAQNFSSWPYFEQANQNALGRYFSSQSQDDERFYYFARSVHYNNKVIGIIVAQISLIDIAFYWELSQIDYVVTDYNGVVFLSSNKEWDLNAISEIGLYSDHKRYHNKKVNSLSKQKIDLEFEGLQTISLLNTEYQMLSQRMKLAGWDVRVLSKFSKTQNVITKNFTISAILIFLLAALALLTSKILNQRKVFRQRTRKELENKVRARTKALKQSQEDLIQAAKMAALGQLSTGITHEINNPLSAIRSYSENAGEFLKKDRLDMVESNLNEITKLTENMATITSQLKTFARKSKGELTLVYVNDAINNAVSIMHSKIVSSGASIDYKQTSADKKKLVLADEIWLSQILVNLISNAISATNTNKDKKVWININTIMLDSKVHHCIEIKDNGTGIEESNLQRIFEPFFTTKPTAKGLGLGLSISFNLAKDMNGSLEARNHNEGGALFTLCLPSS